MDVLVRRFLGLLGTAVVVTSTIACEVSSGDAGQSRSPQGTYSVQFLGRTNRPGVLFVAYTLDARVFKGAQPLVDAWPIHYADWFDSSFESQYVGMSWLAENVLRMESSGVRHLGNLPRDVVNVENNSGRALRLLSVKASDVFLILDVPAGWTSQLRATPQTGDLSWIVAGGVLADGTVHRDHGVNFMLPKGVERPFHYTIDVQPGAIQIRETRHGARIFSSP